VAHEVVRAEEFTERRLSARVPITPNSRSKSIAGGTCSPQAADAVFVAHPKLCAHLVTALAHMNVRNLARRYSLEKGRAREIKAGGGGGAETLSQQAINNSAALQQGRVSIRLNVCSGKLILAAMRIRRVEVDGRSYAAAPTHVSTYVTLPEPAAKNLGICLRWPCSEVL
jgi:hypothetical protein